MHAIRFIIIMLFGLSSCTALYQAKAPHQKVEFRGVWIATVANIDWPKNGNDPIEKQQQDFIDILDFYAQINFNTAIVQIRTSGDALYPTDLAPWSRYLTGEEGKGPEVEGYDPLEWMINETHKRGMEFHAWFNPYRATMTLDTTKLSPEHPFYVHRDWMIPYGTKYYYNPGLPEVKEHLLEIINEVVENYDIDAVHFDDYFYPYKIMNTNFDDLETFEKYADEEQSLDDWRRSNVNTLIRDIHHNINERKPWVQFGISPFGVWRNAHVDPAGSNTRAGQTNYDDLYADPMTWMREGWIDYLIPQIYWSMEFPAAGHRTLVQWWSENSHKNTNLYIGNGPYKIKNDKDKAWDKRTEIPRQISLTRNTDEILGNTYFSAKSLINHEKDVVKLIEKKYYKYPSLTPPLPNTQPSVLSSPEIAELTDQGSFVKMYFKNADLENIRHAMVYGNAKNSDFSLEAPENLLKRCWANQEEDGTISIIMYSQILDKIKHIAITFVDQNGHEGSPIRLFRKKDQFYLAI